jgi:hypothetical protein
MSKPSKAEQRVWSYLLNHKTATAAEVALNCDVSEEFAQFCISRIGTPKEVFELEAYIARMGTEQEMREREAAVPPLGTPKEGRKDDSSKVRYDLIPPELLEATAQVLTFGAAKYNARNWEHGMAWGRPFGALMRHMWAWWRGEEKDPETGYSHLWHAACCIAFLVAYEQRNIGTDDRHKPETKQ